MSVEKTINFQLCGKTLIKWFPPFSVENKQTH